MMDITEVAAGETAVYEFSAVVDEIECQLDQYEALEAQDAADDELTAQAEELNTLLTEELPGQQRDAYEAVVDFLQYRTRLENRERHGTTVPEIDAMSDVSQDYLETAVDRTIERYMNDMDRLSGFSEKTSRDVVADVFVEDTRTHDAWGRPLPDTATSRNPSRTGGATATAATKQESQSMRQVYGDQKQQASLLEKVKDRIADSTIEEKALYGGIAAGAVYLLGRKHLKGKHRGE